MTQIVQYLGRLTNARYYDDRELAKLQTVYDRGRFILDIGIDDPRRERLAILIFECSDQTTDVESLLANVIKRFDREVRK